MRSRGGRITWAANSRASGGKSLCENRLSGRTASGKSGRLLPAQGVPAKENAVSLPYGLPKRPTTTHDQEGRPPLARAGTDPHSCTNPFRTTAERNYALGQHQAICQAPRRLASTHHHYPHLPPPSGALKSADQARTHRHNTHKRYTQNYLGDRDCPRAQVVATTFRKSAPGTLAPPFRANQNTQPNNLLRCMLVLSGRIRKSPKPTRPYNVIPYKTSLSA